MLEGEMRSQLQEQGFCVFPAVLTSEELDRARAGLDRGVEWMRQVMPAQLDHQLDPNEANVRVINLPAIDPIFIDLLIHHEALSAVEAVLGPHVLVSNFTANIALPGSGSMKLHSDQALIVPPPWPHPWAANIIWCLDDIYADNGATRYLPGSHRFQSLEEVPPDAMERTVAFEAPAGSFIVMEGRLWHTSGQNVTADERRRMLFAYYSSDFIRQQMNWSMMLAPELQGALTAQLRKLFGLSPLGNTRIGSAMTNLAAR
jgi:ectoine hydroxylase-related dioxygenase (phytanoyl-CoA dioxygenase family)